MQWVLVVIFIHSQLGIMDVDVVTMNDEFVCKALASSLNEQDKAKPIKDMRMHHTCEPVDQTWKDQGLKKLLPRD